MKFSRDLFLASLCGVATLLILEGGLRLARDRFDPTFMIPDADLGFALRPNFEASQTKVREVLVKINSDGMRDNDRTVNHPAHTLRVAVLGGSNTENVEVPLEETFEAVMERELSTAFARLGKQVEVLNFGVEGYLMSQVYLVLQRRIWKYDPKVVVLIFDQSKVRGNTRKTFDLSGDPSLYPFCALVDGRLECSRPTATPAEDDKLNSLKLIIDDRIRDIANRSYLLSMVRWATKGLHREAEHLQLLVRRRSPAPAAPRPEADKSDPWPYSPDVPELREAWEISDHLILAMKEECDRHGADFWVVMSNIPIQASPERPVREAFMRKLGLSTLDASDERMERFCVKNGIHALSLTPPLRRYAEEHNTVVSGLEHGKGSHLNQIGNELVGRLLAHELEEHSSVVREWLGQE